jgi:hypothetical protein
LNQNEIAIVTAIIGAAVTIVTWAFERPKLKITSSRARKVAFSFGLGLGVWAVLFAVGTVVYSQSDQVNSVAGVPTTNSPVSPTSPPASSSTTASPVTTATPISTTGSSVSISIQDPHTTNINYLHDVPGKMTNFKLGEEAVWILIIIPGDPKLYPQGGCIVTGEESFTCAKTRFGDPGGKGTFYARAIIVSDAQLSILRQHYSSGLTSMPKVIAKSTLIRYTKG